MSEMSTQQKSSVLMYSIPYCPFCVGAKQMLDQLGVQYEDVDISGERDRRAFTAQILPGHYSAPLIVIGDEAIGGYNEMVELHRRGDLLPRIFEDA